MSDAPEREPGEFPEPSALLLDFLSAQGHVSPIAVVTERVRLRFTPAGRAVLVAVLVAFLLSAGLTTDYAIHYFTGGLFMVLGAQWLVGLLAMPRIVVERELPSRCASGARVQVRARAKNVGRLPALDLTVCEMPAKPRVKMLGELEYAASLAPGASVEIAYSFEARRRGAYDFPGPVALSAFPFGLAHTRKKTKAPQRLLVYPHFAKLSAVDLPVGRRYQPGGLQLVSEVGDSGEFVGSREYRPGDRLRDVHHAAWARLGYPVVREFHEEFLCRVALVLDTQLDKQGATALDRLEAAISLGAAVAEVLSRQEYVIDIFAAGPDLYHFEAGRSLAYLDNILDVLACVEGTTKNPFETLAPAIQEELEKISTAVVVMVGWDEARVRFVRFLEERGVATKVLIVHEGKLAIDPVGHVTTAGPVKVLTPAQIAAGVDRL